MAGEYTNDFYARYSDGSGNSAMAVAELVSSRLSPRSVLDIGCGAGVWMDAFVAHGAAHVHGVDGPWSPTAKRGADAFTAVNFENVSDFSAVRLSREKYDLVMSLEFLEHVDANKAEKLVDFICSKGDALLISAAIPLQGGEHHVNEQWPEYWIEKFRARGFVAFDALRLALWDHPQIDSWYRQNFILFFREVPENIRKWGEDLAVALLYAPAARVHPEFYAKKLGRIEYLLTRPLGFVKMLIGERRSGQIGIPPIKNLSRDKFTNG